MNPRPFLRAELQKDRLTSFTPGEKLLERLGWRRHFIFTGEHHAGPGVVRQPLTTELLPGGPNQGEGRVLPLPDHEVLHVAVVLKVRLVKVQVHKVDRYL